MCLFLITLFARARRETKAQQQGKMVKAAKKMQQQALEELMALPDHPDPIAV